MIGATSDTEIDGRTYKPLEPLIRSASSQGIAMPYGRWERTFSYPEVVTPEQLEEKVRFHMKDVTNMRATFALTLEPGSMDPGRGSRRHCCICGSSHRPG